MSLFNKYSPRKIKKGVANGTVINDAVLDLRTYTPNAMEHIEMINAAVIIMPSEPTPEFMEAYAKIPMKNAASTITIKDNQKVSSFSGINEFDDSTIAPDTIYILSGINVIKKSNNNRPIDIIASGITLYAKGTNINFISKSGITKEFDSEIEDVKIFSNGLDIDSDFMDLIDNALIVCSGNMSISSEVDPDLMMHKNIYFVASGNVKCTKKMSIVFQLKSTHSGKLIING